MSEATLFELPASQGRAPSPATRSEEARVLRPVREQLQWVAWDLEAVVPQDHSARAIWDVLEKLDLSAFYGSISAYGISDKAVLALWLLATVEGVGSARQRASLCEAHDAYRWLCGGVPINYPMLSDFRVAHQAALDHLLTQIVASLMAAGAVTLEEVTQDGMRVRASAGASSFRRGERLEECLKVARAQVQRLAQEWEHPAPGVSQRERAARERVARERVQRVEKALEYLPQMRAAKEDQQETRAIEQRAKVTAPRTSTTDPEARVMKMPDGGFRPAYNVELATDTAKGIIVGVAVTAEGTDAGQALPMEEQVARRMGQQPKAYLMDGGFATLEDITALEERGITVYAPVRLPRNKPEEDRYQPRYGRRPPVGRTGPSGRPSAPRGDSPQVVPWRQRMATEEAQAVYKRRGATAEWANAQVRQHGVSQFTVRGLTKVMTVVLLVAVAHDILRWVAALG